MRQLITLGNFVYHTDIYNGKELMEIVGIRRTEVELKGDYSGGTHCVVQTDWMPVDGVIDPDVKECGNKVDGNCPLHNLHCSFPSCKRKENPVNK